MFEIYLHDEGTAFRMELVGDMKDSALREVEACWTTANSVPRNSLVLDLRHLTGADAASRAWVEEKHRSGACLRADTPYSEYLVEEITGKPLSRKSAQAAFRGGKQPRNSRSACSPDHAVLLEFLRSRPPAGWLNGWLTWLSWVPFKGQAED